MAMILITSGGTKVRIDEVRHIGNMSSGRFGADLARAALRQGHQVIFLHAKGSERPDRLTVDLKSKNCLSIFCKELIDDKYLDAVQKNLFCIEYADFDSYAALLEKWLLQAKPDLTLLAAAVSDYGMPPTGGKISSDKDEISFTLTRLPKLITKVKQWCPTTKLIGFKLLVRASPEQIQQAVQSQIAAAGSDFVVVNDLEDIRKGTHIVHLYEAARMEQVETFMETPSNRGMAAELLAYLAFKAVFLGD